jgi:hypothetical protein
MKNVIMLFTGTRLKLCKKIKQKKSILLLTLEYISIFFGAKFHYMIYARNLKFMFLSPLTSVTFFKMIESWILGSF